MFCTASNYWLHKADCNGLKGPQPHWAAMRCYFEHWPRQRHAKATKAATAMSDSGKHHDKNFTNQFEPWEQSWQPSCVAISKWHCLKIEKKIQRSIIIFSHFTHWTALPVWYPPFSNPNCLDWLPHGITSPSAPPRWKDCKAPRDKVPHVFEFGFGRIGCVPSKFHMGFQDLYPCVIINITTMRFKEMGSIGPI